MAGTGGRPGSVSDQFARGAITGGERLFGGRGTWPGPRRPVPAPGM